MTDPFDEDFYRSEDYYPIDNNNKIEVDKWTVGKWIVGWSQKELDELIIDLINGTYTTEQLSDDFDEWVADNIDVGE